jgi:hypothetical protein
MIFSLGRFGIAPAEHVKALEKRWVAYRKERGLDLHGNPAAPKPSSVPSCSHPDLR